VPGKHPGCDRAPSNGAATAACPQVRIAFPHIELIRSPKYRDAVDSGGGRTSQPQIFKQLQTNQHNIQVYCEESLNLAEAARRTKVSYSTLRTACERGKLVHTVVASPSSKKKIHVQLPDVEAYTATIKRRNRQSTTENVSAGSQNQVTVASDPGDVPVTESMPPLVQSADEPAETNSNAPKPDVSNSQNSVPPQQSNLRGQKIPKLRQLKLRLKKLDSLTALRLIAWLSERHASSIAKERKPKPISSAQ
jgi:hypothetical protein